MNQITLDDQTLKELGLDGFSETEKNAILKRIYESLEPRIVSRIAQKVSEEELKKFTEMTEQGKDEEAAQWLKEQVPEDCTRGFSNSRTCEIGLSHHSGITYQSILYLVDEVSRPIL